MNTDRIQVSITYADPLVAIGLSTALGQQAGIDIVQAGEGHVVVTDYLNGLHLASQTQRRPRNRYECLAKVLVVTAQDREHDVRSALDAGVDGYIELGCNVQELVAGVRHLARGARYLSTTAAQRVAESLGRSSLTGREREVLGLVVQGRSNKRIALDLAISIGTVKAHMKAILGKLDASTRTQAASIAVRRGLVARSADE